MTQKWFKSYTNGITCLLCEHFCFLEPNQIGICSNQQNQKNDLITITHNHPYALSIDHIENRPMYHMKPNANVLCLGTHGCNMHCPSCQNSILTQNFHELESLALKSNEIVKLALEQNLDAIAFSYNEPVVYYPFAKEIGLIAKDKNLKTIFQTSGMASELVSNDLESWVDAIHVDLKSFSDATLKSMYGGNLCALKRNLKTYAHSNMHLEITTLLIDGINTDKKELEAMAKFIANELGVHTPWHLSAMMPSFNMSKHKQTKIDTMLMAFEIAKKEGLSYVYFGNVPWLNETTCPSCDELLISRREIELFENHIKDGRCPSCERKVEGIW